MKLMNPKETRDMFMMDETFQSIIRSKSGIDPSCLEINYQGATSASFAEIGTAMTAEFKGGAKEKTTILCLSRALTPGSSYFLFYVIATTGTVTTYNVWYSKPEIFTVVCKTRVLTPGGSSFAFTLGATTYYGWFSKKEIFTVKCLSFAATTTGTYFTYYDSEASPTGYYVWLDKNGDGSTDKPTVAVLTEAVCDISGATTADDVATIVAGVINGLAGTGASATTDTVTVTMATKGDPTEVEDIDTGYTITVTEDGGADPAGTGTGAEFDIKAATTADSVGVIVAGVINALASTSSNSSGTVTTTTTANGNVADAVDVDSGLTITVTEQGGSDPSADGTAIEADISGSTTDADVAGVVKLLIDAITDITATVSTNTITMINDNSGAVTIATNGGDGSTITQIEIGRTDYTGAPIYVVSAEANDQDIAAGDMRKDTVIGIIQPTAVSGLGKKPRIVSEEMNLAGATRVKSAQLLWKRIMHHKGTDWGSAGKDAKGIISLQNVDGATTFLTIAAGVNESEGGVIWVPANWHAMIAEWQLTFMDKALATAGDGATIRAVENGMDDTLNNRIYNTDPDNPYTVITITREHPFQKVKWPTKSPYHGSNVGKLTFEEVLINTSQDISFKAYIIIWYDLNVGK